MDSNLFNIEPLHVAIDVGHAVLDGQTLALLVTDFIKFTLFMREQITAPYGEISAVVYKELLRRSQGETGCRSSLMNRHIKFISESEALFASLVTLFNDIRVSRLQIILGSSLSSFTEAFDIEFPRCRVPGINGGTMNKESDAVSRLFLRQLINRFADTYPSNSIRCTLFVLALCDRDHCPKDFSPRHNICVRPKKNATCAHIKFSGLDIVTQTDSQDANPMDISSDLLWFQSDVSVGSLRGVKIP
uniref:HORMA domain-containing protein n=1 Tax=Spongospora subterranea TaxID=70186 RepID=A0A0H5R7A9_9EUKA|eukprot:CRZ09701.1 hypothetical protein [Spongospora subterranea]